MDSNFYRSNLKKKIWMVTSCCRAVIISRFSFFRFTTPFSPLFNFFPCASIRSWILICIQQSQNQTDYSIKYLQETEKNIYMINWRIRFWKFYFQDHSKKTNSRFIYYLRNANMKRWSDFDIRKKIKIIFLKKNRSKRFGFLTHNFGMCWWRSFWASCTTTTAAATAIAHHRLWII